MQRVGALHNKSCPCVFLLPHVRYVTAGVGVEGSSGV